MTGFGDLLGMMRDLGTVKKKAQEVQEELARQTVEGSAGGGMVVATVTGRQELVGLRIDPEVVDREDVGLLEDLVKAAVGQAMAKARDLQKEAATKMLDGLPIPPGLMGVLGM